MAELCDHEPGMRELERLFGAIYGLTGRPAEVLHEPSRDWNRTWSVTVSRDPDQVPRSYAGQGPTMAQAARDCLYSIGRDLRLDPRDDE